MAAPWPAPRLRLRSVLAGLAGGSMELDVADLLPIGGAAFGVDRLSAFFIVVIALGAIPAALYAIGYTREYAGKYSLAAMGFAFNVFIAAMILVALARNLLTFLALWEIMSLASYFLVITEHKREETLGAGWVYFVMTHAGFAALFLGFLLLARATGTMAFADWSAAAAKLEPSSRNLIFILLAVGFGSKAGVIPLHIWLPRAHPAAPSHVSALMSGVMIKLGVYGLVRVAFDWLGIGPMWWGGLVLVVGAVSAVLGVLYALVEHDLKRLLAYHSVENIGIILLGLGAAMLFQTHRLGALAALALIAALYHTLNHATFKSLLFLGAGAVLHATHTRNMEEMGGLIKRMPQTAVFFLVGSVAIAALPPFNGFISEWLTFQSLLLSFQISAHTVNLIFALGVAALALTSGLAAACFVKAFGITFLALPRSEPAARAREVAWTMRAAMALLALACVVLGVAPSLTLTPLEATVFDLTGAHADMRFDWNALVANDGFGWVAPLWIALGTCRYFSWRFRSRCACWALTNGAATTKHGAAGARCRRRVLNTPRRRLPIPSSGFSRCCIGPFKELDIEFHPESRYFVRTIAYYNEGRLIFEDTLYRPLLRMIQALARAARVLQSGNVHSLLGVHLDCARRLIDPDRVAAPWVSRCAIRHATFYGYRNRYRAITAAYCHVRIAAAGRRDPQGEGAPARAPRRDYFSALRRHSEIAFERSW